MPAATCGSPELLVVGVGKLVGGWLEEASLGRYDIRLAPTSTFAALPWAERRFTHRAVLALRFTL